MAKSGGNPITKGIVWVILLLLIVGLAGFGATNFGGSTRSIGSVGDTEIDIDRYARAVQQELRSFEAQTGQRVTFQQAQSLGLDRVVLRRLVALAALEDEADSIGISVGDAEIRDEVLQTPAFQGVSGQFDREAYEFALENAGLSVSEYEQSLRDEISRTLLQGAVVAGIAPPETFVDTLYGYARETRDLTLLRLTRSDLEEPIPAPSDADLQAFYDENPDRFTLPERKRITYAWLTPEMLVDDLPVSEDELRRLYEDRSAEFNQPERRLVERLIFSDLDAAQAAADAIEAGETDFDTLVEDRGLSLDDVDLGEVARDDLSSDAADAVFGLGSTGIAGPVETGLGPALFRVNAILRAQETPFEDVRDDLRAEFAIDAARRAVEVEREPIEDLLAGGATLEEIGDETPFQTAEILFSPETPSVTGADIDAYEAFRQAAARTEPGDFPELVELEDGGLFALRVDEIVPPTLQPLADVEVEVIEAWDAAEQRARLTDRAESIVAEAEGGAALSEQPGTAVQELGVLRDAFLENTPDSLVETAFDLEEGGLAVVPTDTGAIVLRVDAVNPADPDAPEAAEIKDNLRQSAGQGVAQDVTEAFTGALERQKGIQLNQQAVTAVNQQFN
ncbi:peptidyl-prolyl cis-trans isomerase [Palleronia pelagia]|uniref:Parvulin-like PPIase n=1 Tax=Palleronia pelagia TaxID=387096 RepID=A0A1H8BXF6_9RHOB|nr:peptidyl-prolyl cis-trans isomerase [Palleronia pelagia]SEM87269.1 peptidyl-prolyl cis-trans isomerase D [Palleronia pelagia]